jgi:PAS domain S-box-containing protein
MKVTKNRKTKAQSYLPALMTILVGAIISFIGFALALSWDRQIIKTEFETETENYFETIKREIELNLHAVLSVKALFDSTGGVARSEFRDFVRPHLSVNPSIQAMEWIPLVTRSNRTVYEALAKQNGLSDYYITERDTQGKMIRAVDSPQYFPVYFVEPYNGNEIALGFNLASNSMRKEALEKSRDTGEMAATGRVTLVQEKGSQYGFLVFAPVFYNKGIMEDSVESRAKNLKGFALGVFRIGDIVEKSLTHLKPEFIDIYLYDTSAVSREESFLYFHPARSGTSAFPSTPTREATQAGQFENAKTLDIAGRKWLILMQSAPDFVNARKTWQPRGVLTSGLLLTAILASYLSVRKRAEEALRESEQHYRSLFENMFNGFAYCRMVFERNQPTDFIYLNVNNTFETVTGLKDVIGKKVSEVIPGIRESNPELFETFGRVSLTGSPEQFESYIQALGKWLSISVYSPRKEHFVIVFEDITEREKAEKEIRHLNRIYDVLSQVNQAIVRVRSRDELLSAVCRLVVERGAIDLVWIGCLDKETSAIKPVVHFGDRTRMLTEAGFYADDRPGRQGNPGRAIREGRYFVCNECNVCTCVPEIAPASFGFKSCGSFPLLSGGEVWGALTLCVSEKGFFQEGEIELLNEVALDVSFALDKIEGDNQRESLREQYQRQSMFLKTLIDFMPFQVFYKDTKLRYIGWNKALERDTGLREDQVIGKTVYDIWPQDVADLRERTDRQLLANPDQQSLVYEETAERIDGIRRHYQTNKAIFRNQDGAIGGIIGATADITGLKMAEQSLRNSEERLTMALSASQMGVWEWDVKTDAVYWSPECCNIFGVNNVGWAPGTFGKLVHPEDLTEARRKIIQALRERTVYKHEFRIIRPDGEMRWVSSLGKAEYDPDGEPLLLRGITQDITEQKQLEEERELVNAQLRQAQKLESIGRLAAGIAHEINTPTQYIGDNTRFLFEAFTDIVELLDRYAKVPDAIKAGESLDELILKMKNAAEDADLEYLREEIPKSIQQALDGVERVSRIVRAMKEFSHPGSTEKKQININSAIESTVTVARNEWKYVAELRMDLDPALPLVPCLPGEFNQVILNMIINSAHAIAEKIGEGSAKKGTIDISTGAQGDFVEIRITDSGNGIREDIRSKIFDPFFTTKDVGKGTGQGLAISHSVIVKKHGGTIDFESRPGEGTTFIIKLPV